MVDVFSGFVHGVVSDIWGDRFVYAPLKGSPMRFGIEHIFVLDVILL